MIKILIIKEIEKDSTNKHNCSKHEKGGKKEQKNIMKNNKERLEKYVRNQFRKYVKKNTSKNWDNIKKTTGMQTKYYNFVNAYFNVCIV